jgi:hypothetical protein
LVSASVVENGDNPSPEHFQVPFGGWPVLPALPSLPKTIIVPLGQSHVPTILPHEGAPDPSRAAFPRVLGETSRFLRCVYGSDGLSSPPEMDLSCLPIVPPVLPAWASADDAIVETKCERASKAIPIDVRHLMLPPETRGDIVLVK